MRVLQFLQGGDSVFNGRVRGKNLHEASRLTGNFHGRERVFRLILILDLIDPPINRLQG